jgi:hypothetical protein
MLNVALDGILFHVRSVGHDEDQRIGVGYGNNLLQGGIVLSLCICLSPRRRCAERSLTSISDEIFGDAMAVLSNECHSGRK